MFLAVSDTDCTQTRQVNTASWTEWMEINMDFAAVIKNVTATIELLQIELVRAAAEPRINKEALRTIDDAQQEAHAALKELIRAQQESFRRRIGGHG